MAIKLTLQEFIDRAKLKHGDKYDYSLVDYKGFSNKVTIVCPIHNEFKQNPHDHLIGCGCKQCSYNTNKLKFSSNTDEFIKRSVKPIHRLSVDGM